MAVSILGIGCATATELLVRPMFGYYTPESVGYDFGNHVALVAGALDTWRTTHALPISSDQLVPGVEYPYFLFGNAAFYVLASAISFLLNQPATTGTAATLVLGFATGGVGTYLLGRSFGVDPTYSAVLGFLYATGPYMSLDLLTRTALPEFVVWQIVPLLCFLGRRALRPAAGLASMAALVSLLSLPLYLHKLVGPHIMLFEGLLLLVGMRRAWGWLARVAFLAVSVPALTVFAWLPTLRVSHDRILTFNAGSLGAVEVLNSSFLNYIWPWAQDSLPDALHTPLPEYGDRFDLQVGLLASIGFGYAVWQLFRSHFRPRNRELLVAPIAVIVYSALALGIGGLVDRLPFPLNTIQFSLRLIGLAAFAGLLSLLAGIAEANASTGAPQGWRPHILPGVVAVAVTASTATYWRPPGPIDQILASIGPASLIDHSAFYPRSFRSLFDTSGAIGLDGTLGSRIWPMGLAGGVERGTSGDAHLLPLESRQQWPRTIFLRGTLTESAHPPIELRVNGLETPDSQATRLAAQTVLEPEPIELQVSIPDRIFFVTIECSVPSCLNVEYLGPPNQLDGSVQVPRPLPSQVLARSAFGEWTIRLSDIPPGDYVLPTFDYSFVTIATEDGSPVPSYEFDSRPVIRVDGQPHTFTVGYDLRPELTVLGLWAGLSLSLLAVTELIRRSDRRTASGRPRSRPREPNDALRYPRGTDRRRWL